MCFGPRRLSPRALPMLRRRAPSGRRIPPTGRDSSGRGGGERRSDPSWGRSRTVPDVAPRSGGIASGTGGGESSRADGGGSGQTRGGSDARLVDGEGAKEGAEIAIDGGAELTLRPPDRVPEAQLQGVEQRPIREGESLGEGRALGRAAVSGVAEDRVSHRGEVDTDLVLSSRHGEAVDDRVPRTAPEDPEAGEDARPSSSSIRESRFEWARERSMASLIAASTSNRSAAGSPSTTAR
jgi:hypothetical protein